MNFPPESFYTETLSCIISIYDLTHPGAEERLHREHAAWHGYSDIERLTADCSVLVVWAGGAMRLAA